MSEPISGNWKSFYKDENVFYFSLLRYFDFYRDFLVVQKNGLLRKVNFKIYDVINRETNNYNTHIAQYLKK